EDVEWILRAIPEPLRLEAVDRQRAGGERIDVHADDRKHLRAGSVPEHAAGELGAGEEALDEHGLLVALEEIEDDRSQRVGVGGEVALRDPLGRALVHRLREERKAPAAGDEALDVARVPRERPVRRRDAVGPEDLLGARLVEAKREREWVAAGVR